MAGSLGYADRLKERHDLGGQLGAPEYHETVETLEEKAQAVARMVESASEVFFFTGAGISTSQGIPDFRGPKGIWTLRKKKKPVTAMLTPLEYAKPSFTHMVISTLVALGKARYVCSQNVDSLHLRSGVPRPALAELHGNCLAERSEYMRDFQVETIDFQPTGRRCVKPGCQGVLVDNLLDWESALPDDELDASIEAAERSGLCLVLGSSLQISPANEIPLNTRSKGGELVIVNLQKTPQDGSATMLVRGRVDPFLARVALALALDVLPFVRLDGVVLSHTLLSQAELDMAADIARCHLLPQQQGVAAGGAAVGSSWGFVLAVRSIQGHDCPLPMIAAVTVKVATSAQPAAQPAAGPAAVTDQWAGREGLQAGGAAAGPALSLTVVRAGGREAEAGSKQCRVWGGASAYPGGRTLTIYAQPPAPAPLAASQHTTNVPPTNPAPTPGSLAAPGPALDPPATAPTAPASPHVLPTSGVGEPQPDSSHPLVSAQGPFEVLVQVLSPGVTRCEVQVELHLVPWADPGRQQVLLPCCCVEAPWGQAVGGVEGRGAAGQEPGAAAAGSAAATPAAVATPVMAVAGDAGEAAFESNSQVPSAAAAATVVGGGAAVATGTADTATEAAADQGAAGMWRPGVSQQPVRAVSPVLDDHKGARLDAAAAAGVRGEQPSEGQGLKQEASQGPHPPAWRARLAAMDQEVAVAIDQAGVRLPAQAPAAMVACLAGQSGGHSKAAGTSAGQGCEGARQTPGNERTAGRPDNAAQVKSEQNPQQTWQQQQQQQQPEVKGQGEQVLGSSGELKVDDLSGPSVLARLPACTIFTFVTQLVAYSAKDIWDSFIRAPPAVKLPGGKGGKRVAEAATGQGSAGEGSEGLAAGLRRSARSKTKSRRTYESDSSNA
ncbi:hypothetical protein QJQ45_005158 [Haematococcus lacustris]|nr:hypothetical protein QJQ45_005158 [Haematococcus lacustris]